MTHSSAFWRCPVPTPRVAVPPSWCFLRALSLITQRFFSTCMHDTRRTIHGTVPLQRIPEHTRVSYYYFSATLLFFFFNDDDDDDDDGDFLLVLFGSNECFGEKRSEIPSDSSIMDM